MASAATKMVEFSGNLTAHSVEFFKGLESLGWAGQAVYVLGLGVYTMLCLPTTPVEVAFGFIFKAVPVRATGLSALGKTVGSIAALLVGRRLLKPLIERWASSTGGPLRRRLIHELRNNPIQTMSLLRATPGLPTPFKVYGLCLFPSELVPVSTYAGIAITFNVAWSLVWSLAGSSARGMEDLSNGGGGGAFATKVSILLVLFVLFTMFARYAKEQLSLTPGEDTGLLD
uniref:VTT domain-containing protein n=1 Tax=Haptolina brevifila TaxID=156173 RepID=A0A7S2DSW5_9EUKA|mmetsp:Transcript_43513/g.87095  ORF Transcript_43513/g.87095 Transcript_43513/m.87095 type:complete len:229 (+) Transcript_43513:162-848(+)